jgi:solute carrier family 25 S-adenosylmethionine transporter 26
MISAIIGESSQVLVRNPLELIKQNMQLGRYNSVKEGLRSIYEINGFKGLYRGYLITVSREIPFGLLQYPLYEYFKKRRKRSFKIQENYSMHYAICGAQAGCISAFLTTPLDVVKTRIMTQNRNQFDIKDTIPMFKRIYQSEGLIPFFSGVHIRVLYITIGGMIFFGSNETLKNKFSYMN